MSRPTVYQACPITNGGTACRSEVHANVIDAIEVAQQLVEAGFSPMCPALTAYWAWQLEDSGRKDNSWEVWLEIDKEWLLKSDYLLRCEGESAGADQEVEWAKEAGIPVCYSVEELIDTRTLREQWTQGTPITTPYTQFPLQFPSVWTMETDATMREIVREEGKKLAKGGRVDMEYWVEREGPELFIPLTGEIRVTDPATGGMKGDKLAKFSSIPADVLWELAEHYGKGEAKYPDIDGERPNWMRGYSWRLTVNAMMRHVNLWQRGESIDPETGSSHLVAAIWHMFALRWFELHNVGTDYRETE